MTTKRWSLLAIVLFFASMLSLIPPGANRADDAPALAVKPLVTFAGNRAGVVALAFVAEGNRVVSVSPKDVRIWDMATGKVVRTFQGHTAAIVRLDFHPDDRRLASASDDRTVRVWDTTTGKRIESIPFGGGPIRDLKFSPDGKHLAAGEGADGAGVVQLWPSPAE